MFRLTARRLENAKPILEHYRSRLLGNHKFDAAQFEHELRDLWNVGNLEMKSVSEQLLRYDRYRLVAAYYMENIDDQFSCEDFHEPLAQLYGIEWYHAADRDEARERFWTSALHVSAGR